MPAEWQKYGESFASSSPVFKKNLEASQPKKVVDSHIKRFIKAAFSTNGFTGTELKEAIDEKQKSAFKEALKEITRDVVLKSWKTSEEKQRKNFFQLEDFIAISMLRESKQKKSSEALKFLLGNSSHKAKVLGFNPIKPYLATMDNDGVESIPMAYYKEFIKSDFTVYASLNTPIPEKIFQISL